MPFRTVALFLALFLSSLGLFGLALFIMTQRTKEIGIRKVLGASIQSILILFAKEHLTLIIIAAIIITTIVVFISLEGVDPDIANFNLFKPSNSTTTEKTPPSTP